MTESQLPGVGVRYEFTTDAGENLGVIVHRGGHREVIVFDSDDVDDCTTVLHLSIDDARTLADLLGATRVAEVSTAVQQNIEGLSIDWLTVQGSSSLIGGTIADGMIRTRTGVSIVAVIRDGTTIPSPGPDFAFAADDVAVAVGTPAGIGEVRSMLGW